MVLPGRPSFDPDELDRRHARAAGRAAAELPEPTTGDLGVATLDALWQLLVRAAVLWYAGFAVWALLF